jgi:hypothetical protein
MNLRSAALRSVAPLLLSVLIAGRQAPAYSGATLLQSGTLTLQSSSVWTLSYDANTGGNLAGIVPTIAPAPQVEIIQMDRTGHPLNGIPNTYQPKYDEGYDVGYATGYDSGLVTGKQRGINEGTATGQSDGYNKGFGETYQPAFDLAYNTQLPIGKAAGWNQGNVDGFAEGYDWAPTFFGSVSVSNSNSNSGIWGSFSGIMLNSGGYGINSNVRIMTPDEVPAFYYQLGLDDGNTKGVSEGSAAGYKLTYADAYAAAFPIGYENGTVEGTSQGTANGNREGFSAGWDLGYGPGFDSGFDAGIQHYLSGHQPMSTYGTLEVTLSGSSFLGVLPVISFGATSDGVDLGLEPSVPEPTSFALLGVATAVVMLRRAGRS